MSFEAFSDQRTSLTSKVLKGGTWLFALRITGKIIGLLRIVILARILLPQDFGLVGIAAMAVGTLETFSSTGFQAALVQKNRYAAEDLNTAWTVSAARGLVLFVLLYASAPYIAAFFESPASLPIIRVVAFSMVLAGFRNQAIVLFQRELKFHKQFLYELSAILAELLAVLILAYWLRNVWALVFSGLAANVTRLFMSYILCPQRPRPAFNGRRFRTLFDFGRWVFFSNVLVFLITQGDDIFVGKVVGVSALGLYQIAFRLSNLPTTEISHVISSVTFPAYARIQDDLARVRAAYGRVLRVTLLISVPMAAGIFLMAEEGIEILLGRHWLAAVPVIRVLAAAGLLRSIASTTGPIFHGLGQPRIDAHWQIVRLAVLALAIYPLSRYFGILGVAAAVLASIFVATVGFLIMAAKILQFRFMDIFNSLLQPLGATLVMLFSITVLKMIFGTEHAWQLVCWIFGGALSYVIAALISDRWFGNPVVLLIQRGWKAK
jgi:O-antigen/teichoic acid export membrane protein